MPLVEATCAWCGQPYGHLLVEGSTGLCQTCLDRLYPEEADGEQAGEEDLWPPAVGWSVAAVLGLGGWYLVAHVAVWMWKAW